MSLFIRSPQRRIESGPISQATDGREIDIKLRFTELYVKQQAAWKQAMWQSTRVPDPAP